MIANEDVRAAALPQAALQATGDAHRSPSAHADAQADRWDRARGEAFVDAEYPRLFAWLCWLTGRRDAAAELTQESFAAFWESLSRRSVREPSIWLFRIARNQWRKACRRPRLHPLDQATCDGNGAVAACPSEQISKDEATRRIAALVRELPAQYREAITLRYWADFSHEQIARVQGVPTPLARWRVHWGQRMLADRLRHDGLLEAGAS